MQHIRSQTKQNKTKKTQEAHTREVAEVSGEGLEGTVGTGISGLGTATALRTGAVCVYVCMYRGGVHWGRHSAA